MRKYLYNTMIFFALLSSVVKANSQTGVVSTYFIHPVECISVELDGSVTLRVAGKGRNKADAIEQARKNAVYAVIFKGVDVRGQNPMMSKPLILEVNAEQKYQYFFNPFFTDGGKYKRFITKESTRGGTNVRQKGSGQVEYTITICVNRSQLKDYLVENNIIKP